MTTKAELLQAIRKHCLECCGGSWAEVRDCTPMITPSGERRCTLYPYRFGSDPKPARKSDNLDGHRHNSEKDMEMSGGIDE